MAAFGCSLTLGAAGLARDQFLLRAAMPIGLSYATLMRIGYVLDVHHRRLRAERSLLRFATFAAFFPQVVSGPITRGGTMLPQFGAPRHLGTEQLRSALCCWDGS